MYITDQTSFEAFINRAMSETIVAIDTEFLREKTYWPRLCLLQMATEHECVAVDPFYISDLSVLRQLFLNESVVKVFHSAKQDLELLLHEIGVLPRPLFDTQIAASLLCGMIQIGLGSLVQSECGIKLKKGDSFTDWSRRPLTDSQLTYALDDVRYLPHIYRNMVEKLTALNRLEWLTDDFNNLLIEDNYYPHPEMRYQKLKRANQLNPRQLSAARELTAWRERIAIKRNIPRKWVLSDEQIVEACRREPRTLDELFMVRGLAQSLKTADAREALRSLQSGLNAPRDTWPTQNKQYKNEASVDAQVDLLSSLVKLRAKQAGLAAAVLASHSDLTLVARRHFDKAEVMQGWRRSVVGAELQELVLGKLSLSLVDGVVKVTALSQDVSTCAK